MIYRDELNELICEIVGSKDKYIVRLTNESDDMLALLFFPTKEQAVSTAKSLVGID